MGRWLRESCEGGCIGDVWLVFGYSLGALSKPLFAVASTAGMVFTARFIDRIGKGIRGAPRDALVADVAPSEMRGASFGLRQSLDTVGSFIGPLLAFEGHQHAQAQHHRHHR